MPHDPTSPTLLVCDQIVTYIRQQWGPKAPDEVRREYNLRIDFSKVTGRLVLVVPLGYVNNPSDRGKDVYTHRIGVGVFRRYTDAADPDVVIPRDWLDTEVDFVNTYVAEGLDFTHDTTFGATAPFNRNLQTLSTDVPNVFDEELINRKEFWCEVECVFEELIP